MTKNPRNRELDIIHRSLDFASRLRKAAAVIIVLVGLRLTYLFAAFLYGSATIHRFHVESAALLFVALGLAFRLSQHQSSSPELAAASIPSILWFVFGAAALVLYWKALWIGWLSDDYVLAARARDWQIGAVSPSLFRPIPLIVWAALLQIGGGPLVLHATNIMLHATNAYLTVLLVHGWRRDRVWSLLSGLLVLTAPVAPEAVAWCSGIFDLSATALVLASILSARRYDDRPPPSTRLLFLATAIAALASKETAAVGIVLVVIDAWLRHALSRALIRDVAVVAVVAGAFAGVRLLLAFGLTSPTLSRYTLQRMLFGAFGSLAVPWHSTVIASAPWLAVLEVAILVFALTRFFVASTSKQRLRQALASVSFVLLPIAPVWSSFFVDADLQGSRFLYLPFVGWASLIAVIASSDDSCDRLWDRLGCATVVILIAGGVFGVRRHLEPWTQAATLRNHVEAVARSDPRLQACSTINLTGLPDSVQGAYVFRNGVAEAFAHDLHARVATVMRADTCSFEWNDSRASFMPAALR